MLNQERKNKVNIGNLNQMVKQELFNDKYVKTVVYIGAAVAGFFALGFVFKAVNYTADNFKILSRTIKQ